MYTVTVQIPDAAPDTRTVEADGFFDAIQQVRREYIKAKLSLVGAKVKAVKNEQP